MTKLPDLHTSYCDDPPADSNPGWCGNCGAPIDEVESAKVSPGVWHISPRDAARCMDMLADGLAIDAPEEES